MWIWDMRNTLLLHCLWFSYSFKYHCIKRCSHFNCFRITDHAEEQLRRDPWSLEFPNSMIFWIFNPTNSTMWKPAWKLEWKDENKEFETEFFYQKNLISLCLSFPSCSRAIRKSAPIFAVGVWVLMKRFHALQMRASIQPLGALMLL